MPEVMKDSMRFWSSITDKAPYWALTKARARSTTFWSTISRESSP
jgi:hypothetical protein